MINGSLSVTQYSAPVLGLSLRKVAYIPIPMLVDTASANKASNVLSPAGGSPIYITSAGNDSGITFTITGLSDHGSPTSTVETINGTNASVVCSKKGYSCIFSIVPSGNTASTVTVGTGGFGILDTARRIIFTSSGTDTGLTITITGRDWSGSEITETVTGGSSGAPASTVLDYLAATQVSVSGATAGTISVGTNGVCGSPWVSLDGWSLAQIEGQCVVTGTANYTVQITNDDPNSYANAVARVCDVGLQRCGVFAQTTSQSFGLPYCPVWARVLMNSESGTGHVAMTLNQSGSVTR